MSEYRPGGFSILTPVIKNLVIINVLVFATTYVLKKIGLIDLDYYLALFHWKSPLFKPWQVITHMFMHGNLTHLFFNMLALWMFGSVIENVLGAKRFIIFYLVCGLGAAVCHMLVFSWENAASISWYSNLSASEQKEIFNYIASTHFEYAPPQIASQIAPLVNPMLGASGAIFGLLFAFGYLFPDMMIYVYFLVPVKAKYFVAIYAIVELFAGFRNSPADNIAHFAHIGGMIFAFLLLRAWRLSSKNMWRY